MLLIVTVAAIVVVGLAAAFFATAVPRHKAANREKLAAQALYAAEAGVARARFDLFNGRTDGFSDELRGPDGQANSADDGQPYGSVPVAIRDDMTSVTYDVRIVDDNDGDSNLLTDSNNTVLIRSVGRAGQGVTVSKTIVSPVQIITSQGWKTNKAIIVNGDFQISGSPDIAGVMSNVHANGNLTIQGNPAIDLIASSAENIIITGSPNINGVNLNSETLRTEYATAHSNAAHESVPDVDVNLFYPQSDYRMISSGTYEGFVYNTATGVYSDARASEVRYWKYQGGGVWENPKNSSWAPATYFVEGTAKMTGSPGSATSPVVGSVIATGDVIIAGNLHMTKDHTSVVVACGGDLKITGSPDLQIQDQSAEGAFLVRGQVTITGNPALRGSVTVQNVAGAGTLFSDNDISGNASIVYDGLLAPVPELIIQNANVVVQSWSVQ